MTEDLRALLRADLSGERPPPLGDLVGTAIREGRRPNGSSLLPDMPRIYQVISDEDLSKIFAYLKTLPPSGTKTKNQSL